MSERNSLDRIRDVLEGRAPAGDAERLRSELADDAALRDDFELWRGVHALTAVEAPLPASRVTADDVLRRVARARLVRLRRWAVAAGLLLAVSGGVAASVAWSRPAEVQLAVLQVPADGVRDDARPDAPGPDVPAALADYAPVRDGKVQWLTSWDEATALGRAASKPVFAWVHHPQCPACVLLERDTFTDAGVLGDVAAFVPVKVDVESLAEDDPLAKRLSAGWPYLAAFRIDGAAILEIVGRWQLADVGPELHRAAEEARRLDPAQPSWDAVRAAARDVRDASALASDGRLGDALAYLRRAADVAPGTAPAVRAAAEERALTLRAQAALDGAAAGRVPAAELDRIAARFAGSGPGDDLAAVARALRETGRFPRLTRRETNR